MSAVCWQAVYPVPHICNEPRDRGNGIGLPKGPIVNS